jgi:hypothetical protein
MRSRAARARVGQEGSLTSKTMVAEASGAGGGADRAGMCFHRCRSRGGWDCTLQVDYNGE